MRPSERRLNNKYGDKRLEKLHRVLLMMLDDFSDICEREGLEWFGAYGTNIGAVRHQGFIPWDDDVDICMLRKDYDRFLQAVSQDSSSKYEVIDPSLSDDYPLPTARFMLKGTKFYDDYLGELNFDSGIFLDIFPLDNRPENDFLMVRQALHAWFWNKLAIAKAMPHPYVAGSGILPTLVRKGVVAAHGFLNLPIVSSLDLNARALSWSKRYNSQETTRVGYICDTNPFWDILRRDELFPTKVVPFEDTTIPLPKEFDAWLKKIYGDYMTPPPVELRAEHYPDVLDFGEYEEDLRD